MEYYVQLEGETIEVFEAPGEALRFAREIGGRVVYGGNPDRGEKVAELTGSGPTSQLQVAPAPALEADADADAETDLSGPAVESSGEGVAFGHASEAEAVQNHPELSQTATLSLLSESECGVAGQLLAAFIARPDFSLGQAESFVCVAVALARQISGVATDGTLPEGFEPLRKAEIRSRIQPIIDPASPAGANGTQQPIPVQVMQPQVERIRYEKNGRTLYVPVNSPEGQLALEQKRKRDAGLS